MSRSPRIAFESSSIEPSEEWGDPLLSGRRDDPAEPPRRVQVVLNPFVPCWAAADVTLDEKGVPVAELDLDFRLPPAFLARAFAGVDWLSPDDARVRITGDMLAVLASAERRQVSDWAPATVGEVLFNRWD